MIEYFRSGPGRLLAFALALQLLGGAVVPWNSDVGGLYTLPVIGGIGLAYTALGLSLENHKLAAFAAALALPFAWFAYLLFVGWAVPRVPELRYVMGATGFGFLAMAVLPRLPARSAWRITHPRSA